MVIAAAVHVQIGNGGTKPYSYLWNTGSTDSCIISLLAGTYSVTVIDTNSCTVTDTVAISEPDSLKVRINYNTGSDSASANTSGGTLPYFYIWSNGQTDSTATGLTPGMLPVSNNAMKMVNKNASKMVNSDA